MKILKIDVDIVILCGGLGTRLNTLLPNAPKALASINGIPFLDKLMTTVNKQGFEKFVLCVGHLKQQIIDHYSQTTNFDISYSLESQQLGTGGAIKNALPAIKNNFFIAMNGDSFCDVSLKSLIEFHQKKNADISVVISTADNERDDVGNIAIDENYKIISFSEKSKKTVSQNINAGIYVINKSVIDSFDAKMFSLEVDLFPKLIKNKNIYGFETNNLVYDIGTPKRYKKFINEDFL
mgnify:FL=1|tara:strand:+ start:900 stop:1610 length:711 start_codon:yes stop_codon:yes gene_type:complete